MALRFASGRYQGWSDHSIGTDEAVLATILGARGIEKHVCLPQQARPIRAFEASPAQFAELRHRVDEGPLRFVGRWDHAG